MIQKIYQIDAFADEVFTGNPAAVCPLNGWMEDDLMQKIALENNLAETAFFVPIENGYEIRWFTPTIEVDLCGHATLATAFVLQNFEGFTGKKIEFHSKNSGILNVSLENDFLTLDFPADPLQKIDNLSQFEKCFAFRPIEAYKGKTDFLLVFENEEQIKHIEPNFSEMAKLDARGIIITSKSEHYDFVSRFFAPQSGIDEDPVTGSAHTSLIPYWSQKLDKKNMVAKQISPRGGVLQCEDKGNRVLIGGTCKTYMVGEIFLK